MPLDVQSRAEIQAQIEALVQMAREELAVAGGS
jgi:hypothetical protein